MAHSEEYVSLVVKLADAEQELVEAESAVGESQDRVRRALETMESRVRRILEQGLTNPERGYEITFLDEALREIDEADRRYEVDFASRTAARRRHDLIKGLIDLLKPDEG